MLSNYDALAVAEVMGLAFLRSSTEGPAPARKASDVRTGPPGQDVVIHVGDATLLVVERKTKSFSGSSEKLPPTPAFIEKAVERGLPREALRHVAEWLAGGDRAKISPLEWGVVPKTTLERREVQLSPQESERTERVARLAVHARRALGTQAEARAFMTAPHPELDGRTPLDAAMTDLGARHAEQILNALEYGLAL